MKCSPAVVLGVRHVLQVPGDALSEGSYQPGEGGTPVSALTECPQHQRGLTDGGQPVAPDIADDHPGRGMRGAGERKQITPDLDLVLRGHIQPCHLQRPDPAWRRPQQNPLSRLRHRARQAQRPLAPLPHKPHENHQGGEHGQRDDLRHAVGRGQSTDEDNDEHLGRHCQGPGESGEPCPGEGSGQSGRDDQQRAQLDIGPAVDIQHGDRHNQHERDRHQTTA